MAHEPIRTCCGCRKKKSKKSCFIRFYAGPGGELKVDERQDQGGRGAYICRNESCFESALKKKAFYWTLKRDLLQIDVENLRQMVINMRSGLSG
jgi:uncharacterized protein